MRLLKKFYDKFHPEPPEVVQTNPDTGEILIVGVAKTEEILRIAELQAEKASVDAASAAGIIGKLRDQLKRNHIGEVLEANMRGMDYR